MKYREEIGAALNIEDNCTWLESKATELFSTLNLKTNSMRAIHILLVEDNEGDILLAREALEDAKINAKLSVAKDGKEALDLLNKEGKYTGANTPDLLLLDVNLPKKNGHEVLKYIKENENLRHIPVIMLTTSSSEKDIDLAYNNYASCYITKPVDVNEFLGVMATIENFWISIVKLPTNKTDTNVER